MRRCRGCQGLRKYLPAATPGKFAQVANDRTNKGERCVGIASVRAMAWTDVRKPHSLDGGVLSRNFIDKMDADPAKGQ